MKKKLAIIGGGYMAGIFAENAREMGIESHCFSLESGIKKKELFDYIYPIDIFDKDRIVSICENIGIHGVVATTELTIQIASYVAERLHLIGIPLETAEVITDKYRNREITRDVPGLFHPRYSEIYTVQDIINLNYDYPIILKPTTKGGKRGITVINSANEINKAFDYAMKESNGELPFIVEEYINDGIECSVESLSDNNKHYIIQVTEKVTSGAPHCVELAHHQPASLSPSDRKHVEEVMNKALNAVGIVNGSCHTEIKVREGKIYLIEFNARPGGDHIAYPLTELSTGYSYIKGAINIALNDFKDFDVRKLEHRCAGVMFVTQQTAELKPIFDNCLNYKWCYKKNFVSEELQNIEHNDGFNINYFIYLDKKRPNFYE